MTLLALGINHDTASIDIREQLAFAPDEVKRALEHGIRAGVASEIAILSTCNRTELYCSTKESGAELLAWLASTKNVSVDALQQSAYTYEEHEAARHMMKVASGLDSLVLGEPQILGQMKSSYALADEHNSIGSTMHTTFQQVFAVAKRVRSETAIGENPVSVAYAAVSLAQQIFSDLRQDTALLVGAGETIDLVARHLSEQGIKKILVANRSLENAQRLAGEFGGEALLLPNIPEYLPQADIVISSTASPLPLIGKGMVEQALKARRHKPMFMVDIAVPRDIESQVGELNDIFLYTVDDLREVIDENKRSREKAAAIAEEIIDEGVRKYTTELKALNSVSTIKEFREHVTELTDLELDKALKSLQAGNNAEEVIQRFARSLSNKIMHEPTAAIKRAGAENNFELIESIKKLFMLPDSKNER